MPQFDLSTAETQIFWLLVIFTGLYLVMSRFVLPRMTSVMELRQKKIDDDLARAERLKAEAETVLAEYERGLAEARARAGELIKQATEQAQAESRARLAVFGEELARRTGEAESRIAAAEARARESLRVIATETAGLALRRLAGVETSQSEVAAAVDQAMARQEGARP